MLREAQYIAKNANQIENPKGITVKERPQAPRNPFYVNAPMSDDE